MDLLLGLLPDLYFLTCISMAAFQLFKPLLFFSGGLFPHVIWHVHFYLGPSFLHSDWHCLLRCPLTCFLNVLSNVIPIILPFLTSYNFSHLTHLQCFFFVQDLVFLGPSFSSGLSEPRLTTYFGHVFQLLLYLFFDILLFLWDLLFSLACPPNHLFVPLTFSNHLSP